jgi:hypothetical protein
MRWPAALGLGLALFSGLVGCRSNSGNIEAELRAREDDVRHLREELDRSEFLNQSLSRELAAQRGIPGPTGVIEKPTEPYPLRSIRLGRGTSGRAADCGGDDALQVQVEPVDCDGQTFKAPGCLYVEVMEVSTEGLKRPLSSWEVDANQLRRKWQSGLFNTGYMLTFPWKTPPSTEKLRVLARFKLLDGRIFEADKDITIRLLPEHMRRTLPVPAPVLPTPTPTLPKPAEGTPPPTIVPPMTDGPKLTSGKIAPTGPSVELLRPVPTPLQPE